jgi:16S rRNA (cytidine1402-2'-O)-methyltransferase
MNHHYGKLFLIPNVIAENTAKVVIADYIKTELYGIRHFLAEDVRTARRYLSSLKVYESIEDLSFSVLDKDTPETDLKKLFEPLVNGNNLGIISESGCPGIADPGALAVAYAHQHNIHVVPMVGPSSIIMALMASGLNGQCFAFHGYLPIESKDVAKAIKELERESRAKKQTQIFIETPFRNNSLMQNLLRNLSDSTLLTRAIDITGQAEEIKTLPVKAWKPIQANLPKLPAVFLFLAQ